MCDVEHKRLQVVVTPAMVATNTHNIAYIHVYKTHRGGVFIIIWLWRGTNELSAGGCAAAGAGERARSGEDQTGVGEWV